MTGKPLRAKTWAIPLPMVPAPTTPTTLISLMREDLYRARDLPCPDQHTRDVIAPAGLVSGGDEAGACLVEVVGVAEDAGDVLVVHLSHQAVGGEEVEVARGNGEVDH